MTMSTDMELGGSDKSMPLLSQVLPSFYLLLTLSADLGCFVTFLKQRETIYLQSKVHFPFKFSSCEETARVVTP